MTCTCAFGALVYESTGRMYYLLKPIIDTCIDVPRTPSTRDES